MPETLSRPWLTPSEVADRLGVKTATLAAWRRSGVGPRAVALGARQYVRYHLDDLRSWEETLRRIPLSA
jgi:DNA-binding transcriptional MerR regulator